MLKRKSIKSFFRIKALTMGLEIIREDDSITTDMSANPTKLYFTFI